MLPLFRTSALAALSCLALSSCAKTSEPQVSGRPAPEFPADWGTSTTMVVHSQALGEDRRIHVFVPAGYEKNTRRYPVLWEGDGEYYFKSLVTAMHELAAVGHMPSSIVVAVETPERRNDMTPKELGRSASDGDPRADAFLDFLTKELRPQLAAKYRTSTPNVLVGHSQGGILCHYAAATRRKDFPFVLSLDAPVHLENNWLEHRLEASKPEAGVLRLVSLEVAFGWNDDEWSSMTKSLPANWHLTRAKMAGEDHESMFFGGAYQGLKSLFADFSASRAKKLPGTQVFDYYEKLAAEYGTAPAPPFALLDRALLELSYTGNGPAARRALAMMNTAYGQQPDTSERNRMIDEAERMMKGKPSVADIVGAPKPTEAEIKPYLGVWKGHMGADGRVANEAELTITLKDGRATAKFAMYIGNDSLVQEVVYLHVTKDGLEFGTMNGMHPRGVCTYVTRLNNGILGGAMEMRGVYFHPKDMPGKPPVLTVDLKREG